MPNMANTFMTRYDYDYNKGDVSNDLKSTVPPVSGHLRNRPLTMRQQADGWKSASHDLFQRPAGGKAADINLVRSAANSRIVNSAHVRGMRSMAGVPWNEEPTISSYKDHFPAKWSTPSGGGAQYAGSRTTGYNPNFLKIDSPDDDGVGKPKRQPGRGATADASLGGGGTRGPQRRQDTMTVFGPTHGVGEPWTTEYSSIGNPDLAKKSLLPRGIKDLTHTHLDKTNPNKNGLLNSLAGRKDVVYKMYGSMFDTNPIPMNPKEMVKCRVAKRGELEGPVNMSMYQSHFVNLTCLPELVDPPGDKSSGKGNTIKAKGPPLRVNAGNSRPPVDRGGALDEFDPHAHKRRTSGRVEV